MLQKNILAGESFQSPPIVLFQIFASLAIQVKTDKIKDFANVNFVLQCRYNTTILSASFKYEIFLKERDLLHDDKVASFAGAGLGGVNSSISGNVYGDGPFSPRYNFYLLIESDCPDGDDWTKTIVKPACPVNSGTSFYYNDVVINLNKLNN